MLKSRNVASSDQIPVDEIAPAEVGEVDLYQKRERIYTRPVEGFYQRIRLFTGWPLLIGYFLLPWLQWNGRQAVLFDLPERQFHIFFISLWPQDLPLLAWLLIIAAFALFTVTVFAGRVWCGYTCPQTIWTCLFMWAEQFTEGTRNQRMKLDASSWSFEKVRKKTAKHALWFGIALATGVTFIGYFVPIREVIPAMMTFDAGFWPYAWGLFFTLATYINAGWMREQLCMYVCPYARFQSAMFDRDTLIVSYDKERGEERGSRKMGVNPRDIGKGDCIDCQMCVQVCPTGIDIREGLQYECITCALCIDACDSVMEKMHYDKGLIRYTTQNRVEQSPGSILRPRLVGYTLATSVMLVLFFYVLVNRVPLELDVIRERGELYQMLENGMVENVYELKILNMSQQEKFYSVSQYGLDNARIIGETWVRIPGGEILELPLRVQADPNGLVMPSTSFTFVVECLEAGHHAESETRFLSPAK